LKKNRDAYAKTVNCLNVSDPTSVSSTNNVILHGVIAMIDIIREAVQRDMAQSVGGCRDAGLLPKPPTRISQVLIENRVNSIRQE